MSSCGSAHNAVTGLVGFGGQLFATAATIRIGEGRRAIIEMTRRPGQGRRREIHFESTIP